MQPHLPTNAPPPPKRVGATWATPVNLPAQPQTVTVALSPESIRALRSAREPRCGFNLNYLLLFAVGYATCAFRDPATRSLALQKYCQEASASQNESYTSGILPFLDEIARKNNVPLPDCNVSTVAPLVQQEDLPLSCSDARFAELSARVDFLEGKCEARSVNFDLFEGENAAWKATFSPPRAQNTNPSKPSVQRGDQPALER